MKDPGNSKKYFGWTSHPTEAARNSEKIDIDSNHYHNIFFAGRNTGKTSRMIEEILGKLDKELTKSSKFFIAGVDTALPKEETIMSLFKYKPSGYMEQIKHGFNFEPITIGEIWEQFSNDILKFPTPSLEEMLKASMVPNERKAPIGPIVPKNKKLGQPVYTRNKDVERKHLYAVDTEIIDSRTEKTLVITSLIPMHHGEEPRYYAKFKNGSCSHIVKESEMTLEED